MDLTKPIKQEVEDSIETPLFPALPILSSIFQNRQLKNAGASGIRNVVKPPLVRNEDVYNPLQIPSSSRVGTPQLQIPATLILSPSRPPLIQVSSSLPGSATPQSSVRIPATSILRVNASHLAPVKIPPTLPPGSRKPPSIAPKKELAPINNAHVVTAPSPVIGKVAKPKKRRQKRYVFSKPKRRSKTKQDLLTNPLLYPETEDSVELSNDADTDGSSNTVIAEDMSTDSNTELIETEEITKPAELGRLLISGGTVKLLPNMAAWEDGKVAPQISSPSVMKTTVNKTETLAGYEDIPSLSAIKKELDETVGVNSAGDISFNKETEVAKNNSLSSPPPIPLFALPLENETGLKKSGKKQTARRGRGKPNNSRPTVLTSEENIRNLIENVVVESANGAYENPFNGPFESTAVNETNLPVAETVLKEKPKRIRAPAKRRPPKKNANVTAAAKIDALLQSITESEGLSSSTLESPKAPPKRKRVATPRKSPNKKNAMTAESGEKSSVSETIPAAKPKRKRAPAKKKKPNPVDDPDATAKELVSDSGLVLSVKKEMSNSDFQDSSSTEKSFSDSTAAKPLGAAADENMIVSLSFEEETPNKEEDIDKLSLLLAYRNRNSKGRFVKSPQTSQKNINSAEVTRVENSSNLPAATTSANEIQNSKTQALSLSYLLLNSEAMKRVDSDNRSSDALKTPLSTSVQESGGDGPLNVNIKKEPVDVTENNFINNKSLAPEHPPIELQIPNQQLTNQNVVQNPPNNIADFDIGPPAPTTTKRKQTARRGRKAAPARKSLQLPNSISDEPSVAVTDDTPVSELANIQPPQTAKRKQTARRGRGRGRQTRQRRSTEKSDNLIEKAVDFLEPVSAPHQQVDSNPASSSVESDWQVPVSARTRHGLSLEKPYNVIEKPVDILEPVATPHQQLDLNPVTSSLESDSQVPKSAVSQQPADFSNISIKTEPKDPEYEVIVLDDSPVKVVPPKNVDNATLQHSRQLNFSGINSSATASPVKKEVFTELEDIPSQHKDTFISLNILHPSEKNLLRTASPVPVLLRSNSETVNASDKLGSTMDSNTAVYESSIANLSQDDDNTQPTPELSLIKKEKEDDYAATSFPDGSPSFINCLKSVNSRNESQSSANLPVYTTSDNAHTRDFDFHNNENARTSSKTLEETWNLPGPSTDAVYSNTLSNVSRLDGYGNVNEQSDIDFQQASSSFCASGDQSTLVRGHSPHEDALAFAGVSMESLKNIIGSMDVMSGTGAKDASNCNSVIFKDLSFQIDQEDTSSRASSFLSRGSPRLSTPHSDSASLRLTDSVSPLTRVPDISHQKNSSAAFTSHQAQNITASDSRCSSLNDPSKKDGPSSEVEDDDETAGLKSIVALKLRLAASLPSNSIKDEGDFVPLENFPVVDGEVECFHKLLLAASFANLTPKPLDTPPMGTASPAMERTDSDLTSETLPNVELNRTSLLDQFIMSKIAEDNSINRGQNVLSNRGVQNFNDERLKQIPSPFIKNESCLVHHKNTLPNSDLSLERFASRRSDLTFNTDVGMEITAPKSDNFAPCPSEVLPQSDISLKSSESASNASESNYIAQKPELNLNILPDLLKVISNLMESSSKTPTSLPEVENKQLEESDCWKIDDSNAQNIPTILTSHSLKSSSSKKKSDSTQKCTLQKNSDEYNQKYSMSSSNLINITLPSNELLYNVIKNTQLPSTDELSCSSPSRGLKSTAKSLNDTFIEGDVVELPQVLPDLQEEAPLNEPVSSNFKGMNNLKNVAASEVYVETMDNLSVTNPSEIRSVKSFASLTESQPGISNTDTGEKVHETSTVEPEKPNPTAAKIDIAELLKILNAAKSLPTNLPAQSTEPSHVNDAYDPEQANFNDAYDPEEANFENESHPHDYIASTHAYQDNNRYSYQDNYRDYSNYEPMQLQAPIVHEYGHKSFIRDPYEDVATNLPATNKTENFSVPSKDPDSSDSDVDNEYVNNESDHQEESVQEDCIEEELSRDEKEESSKDEEKEKNIPQYKSRWERIMERKSKTYEREQKMNEMKEYYSAKVPKSKAKIQKPIAHVQPCSQSSTKKKVTEETGLPLKKKVAKKREGVSLSGSPPKKKAKKAEDSSTDALKKKHTKKAEDASNSLPVKKKKSSKADDVSKKGENISESGLPLKKKKSSKSEGTLKSDQKKKTNQPEKTSIAGLPLKKKFTTDIASPMAKKSKVDKIVHKKHSHSKPKDVLFEDPSDLFTPDKIVKRKEDKVVKKKEVKYSGAPKDEDEAAKRLYGRVSNRGTFLTESSKKQPPMPKSLKEKRSTDKTKSTKLFTDEYHSMINTPEIKIAPERDLLHSRKLSLESYKMKKGIFNDISAGIASPKVDFHSMSYFKHTPTSSAILSSVSPDNSFLASSESSDFFSPPDPFESNSPALPTFQGAKSTFTRTLLPTPESVHPVTMKPSLYTNRPLLPDPVPSFSEGHSSRDYRGVANSQFQSLLLKTPVEIPSSPVIQQPIVPPVQPVIPPQHASSRNRHSRPRATTCVCLPPKTLKASVGSSVFKTFDVMLLILEWNVDWLFQQQKNPEPPPISNTLKKVANSYADFEEYYNAYLPLLLLETWQRIYASWTRLHQASPYFCEITSYAVETHTIRVECQAVFRASDAERGISPEEGNIIMVKFGTKEKGGIKILGYVTNVKVRAFDPSNDPQNTCYKTLKYTASEVLQRISLTFLGAYNSDDFDRNQLIRIQVLCSIKPTLKQNDALLNIKKSPLSTNIINPLNDGLRIVNVITRHPDPLKVKETVNDCVRDIIKGILSPHPLPLLTIAKSLPSSDRLLVLLPLIEKMKHSYKTKVLLCTRTAKALTDIGFHLEGGTVKVVILGNRADIHQKLKKYHLDDLAEHKATSNLPSPLPGFQKTASKEAIDSAKTDILQNCDVILSNIRSCHNNFLAKACEDGDCIPQMCCIIDEANLCTEPEISIPLLYGISKLILIGDPDVLAKVCSKTAMSYDYNRSLFHRAHDLDLASE